MSDRTDDGNPGSLDVAIEACDENIRRNVRAAVAEAAITVLLIALVGAFVLLLARMQGEENDQKRQALKAEFADAATYLESIAAERLPLEDELKVATGEAKDSKADSREAQRLKFLQQRLERLAEQQKSGIAERTKALENLSKHKSPPLLTEPILYGAGAVFIVLVGLLAGLYRQHVREVTRNEQMRLGFHRIRIAANNASLPGFGTEVRASLTHTAFDGTREDVSGKGKKIDSPLPGHPGSDISSAVLNRLLDQVEIVLQPKSK